MTPYQKLDQLADPVNKFERGTLDPSEPDDLTAAAIILQQENGLGKWESVSTVAIWAIARMTIRIWEWADSQ